MEYICSSCHQPCEIRPVPITSPWGRIIGTEASVCCDARAIDADIVERIHGKPPLGPDGPTEHYSDNSLA